MQHPLRSGLLTAITLLAATAATAATAQNDPTHPNRYGWTYDPLYRLTTGWDAGWLRTVREAPPELLRVSPVAGVGIDEVLDRHDNWTAATAAVMPYDGALHGQRIVLSAFNGRFHWRWPITPADLNKDQGDGSTAFVKHSDDGGETWSGGVRVDKTGGFELFNNKDPRRPKVFMKATGTDRGGMLYIVTGRGVGVLKSTDGVTWTRLVGGLTQAELGDESVGLGSRLIDHPRGGLMMFGHLGGSSDKPVDPVVQVLHSTDGGATWTRTAVPTGHPDVMPVEPTALLYDGDKVLLFGRNGHNHNPHRPFQLRLQVNGPGDYAVLDAQPVNMWCTQNPDTHEVILNPFNGRFEAVIHNRGGRAPGVDDEGMCTTLWSIGRDELETGSATWRYDGALNVMQGNYGPMVRDGDQPPEGSLPGGGGQLHPELWQDGSHPAAGVLFDTDGDGTADRHLVFVHMAAATDSFSHVYMIDRTLDTEALRRYLLPRSPEPFDPAAPAAVVRVDDPPRLGRDDNAAAEGLGFLDDVPPFELRNFIAFSQPREPADRQDADLSAAARLAYDDGHLYLRLDVHDDAVLAPDAADPFRGDSVELFLSASPPNDAPAEGAGHAVQLVFAAAPDGGNREEKRGSTDGLTRRFMPTAEGYRLDVSVPWTLLGGPPRGERFGFDVHVNDRDAGEQAARKLTWHAYRNDSWQSSQHYGTAKLVR